MFWLILCFRPCYSVKYSEFKGKHQRNPLSDFSNMWQKREKIQKYIVLRDKNYNWNTCGYDFYSVRMQFIYRKLVTFQSVSIAEITTIQFDSINFFLGTGYVLTVASKNRRTFNSEWYASFCLLKVFGCRRPWIVLHHDNANSQTSTQIIQFRTGQNIKLTYYLIFWRHHLHSVKNGF